MALVASRMRCLGTHRAFHVRGDGEASGQRIRADQPCVARASSTARSPDDAGGSRSNAPRWFPGATRTVWGAKAAVGPSTSTVKSTTTGRRASTRTAIRSGSPTCRKRGGRTSATTPLADEAECVCADRGQYDDQPHGAEDPPSRRRERDAQGDRCGNAEGNGGADRRVDHLGTGVKSMTCSMIPSASKAFDFRARREHDAVPQGRRCKGLDVVRDDVVPPIERRERPRRNRKHVGGSGRCAEAQALVLAGRSNEIDDVVHEVVAQTDATRSMIGPPGERPSMRRGRMPNASGLAIVPRLPWAATMARSSSRSG